MRTLPPTAECPCSGSQGRPALEGRNAKTILLNPSIPSFPTCLWKFNANPSPSTDIATASCSLFRSTAQWSSWERRGAGRQHRLVRGCCVPAGMQAWRHQTMTCFVSLRRTDQSRKPLRNCLYSALQSSLLRTSYHKDESFGKHRTTSLTHSLSDELLQSTPYSSSAAFRQD